MVRISSLDRHLWGGCPNRLAVVYYSAAPGRGPPLFRIFVHLCRAALLPLPWGRLLLRPALQPQFESGDGQVSGAEPVHAALDVEPSESVPCHVVGGSEGHIVGDGDDGERQRNY